MGDRRRKKVIFVDHQTWECFAALAGAMRAHGVGVSRVTARAPGIRRRLEQVAETPLFGRTRRLVIGASGDFARPVIDARRFASLLRPDVVDVQAMDDLVPVIAEAVPSPLVDPARRVGPDVDPAVLSDKWAMQQAASRLGVPTPHAIVAPEARRFPSLVKARVGYAGTAVRIVHDQRELDAAWADLAGPTGAGAIVQEMCDGGIIRTGGVAERGRILAQAAFNSEQDPSDPMGPSLSVAVADDPRVCELSARFVAGIGYTGFFSADFVRDDQAAPRLIDFNGRVFGSWPALEAAGVELIDAYLLLLGVPLRRRTRAIATGRAEGLLRFPFPPMGSLGAVRDRRRDSINIIRGRRAWLGRRWALVSRLKTEVAAARAAVGVRRG